MPYKQILFVLTVFTASSLSAEIIHLSRFKQKRGEFQVKRDLFNSSQIPGAARTSPSPSPEDMEQETVESLQDTLNKSIQFNGYIQSGDTLKATLSISGEFYMVGEGETILDRIKIIKITKEKITIEYEGQPFDIEITKGF